MLLPQDARVPAAGSPEHEASAHRVVPHDPSPQPEGIAVKPGKTKDLTYTFAQADEPLAGCHVVGHHGGGMKATVTVSG